MSSEALIQFILFVSGFYAQISQDNIKWKSLASWLQFIVFNLWGAKMICTFLNGARIVSFLSAFSLHFSDMQIYFL